MSEECNKFVTFCGILIRKKSVKIFCIAIVDDFFNDYNEIKSIIFFSKF